MEPDIVPPDAIDDALNVLASEAGGDNDGNVRDNDTNPDGPALPVVRVNGSAASVGVPVAGSAGGLITINSNGTFDFNANGDFDSLLVGETAETTFTYGISFTGLSSVADVVLLEDLSGSFGDDLPNVRAQFSGLFDTLNSGGRDVDFGVASFIDKPVSPFGSFGDFVYNTDLGVSGDKTAVQTALDGLVLGSGNDGPEAQVESLFQLALRAGGEVGYRDGAQRIVVLSTDATAHLAGDNAGAGPNDGDAVVENEDYPTVTQLKNALDAADIFPIFSVTSGVVAYYEDLVTQLGRGDVVQITSDSSNLAAAIIATLETIDTIDTATVTVTVEGTGTEPPVDDCEEVILTNPSETVLFDGDHLIIRNFDINQSGRMPPELTSDTLSFEFKGKDYDLNSTKDILNFISFIEHDGDGATDAVYDKEGNLGLILARNGDGTVKDGIVFADLMPSDGITESSVKSKGADIENKFFPVKENDAFCGFFEPDGMFV